MENSTAANGSRSEYKKHSLWTDVWIRLRKNTIAVIAIIVFLCILFVCLAAPLIYDYDADIVQPDISRQMQPPSKEHILGCDEIGRDILARIIWGGRITIIVSFCALGIAFLIGIVLGTVAAFYGGWAETIIMRIIDIIMSVPSVLLMITLATLIKPSIPNLTFVVAFGLIPNQARIIRGQVLQVIDQEYIKAARVQGASDFRIIVDHILPNAISPIITTTILDIAYAVMTISTLSFLGLGVQQPNPEWGTMLNSGRQYLRQAWHMSTFPGIALTITLMALTLIGDGLRDALDPRMKR